jgi:hypothetical protein
MLAFNQKGIVICKGIKKKAYGIASITTFLLSIVGLVSVIALDKSYWGTGIFLEGWPDLSRGYLIRSIVIFISISAMFWSLIGRNRPRLVLADSDGLPIERLSILGMLLVTIILLFLFLFKTSVFNTIWLEDSYIEWGSFIFLISSSITFIVSFATGRNNVIVSRLTRWTLLFLALAFFIIAMEEVSWFQRVLEVKTPGLFSKNLHGELNLHNFIINQVENAYYFAAFLFLVVLPFIRAIFQTMFKDNRMKVFVPRPFISIIGAIVCAYNFDLWNIIFTQIAFFGAVVILFAYVLFCINWKDRIIALFAIFVIIITQAYFLTNVQKFFRIWEIREYKEFMITLAFFVYAVDVYRCINHTYRAEKS